MCGRHRRTEVAVGGGGRRRIRRRGGLSLRELPRINATEARARRGRRTTKAESFPDTNWIIGGCGGVTKIRSLSFCLGR